MSSYNYISIICFWMDFLLAGTAAMGACFFSNPFEVVRTRMQLQGELKSRQERVVYYKNVFHAAYVIARVDGILALHKGLSTGLCVQLLLNGTRLGVYQYLDRLGIMRNEKGEIEFYKSIICASFTGAVGCAISNPLIMVKTQLQNQATKTIAVGYQHHHSGPYHALKKIYTKHGWKGLRHGILVNTIRGIIGSPTQLTTFVYTKELLMRKGALPENPVLVIVMSSLLGGICNSMAMNPFDLVNTRLYNQHLDKHGKGTTYTGIIDCVVKIWHKEGFTGFYKGLITNYMRNGVHTVFCFVFWEHLKAYFGHNIKIENRNK